MVSLDETLSETYEYTAFGETTSSGLSPWRFSSKRQDPSTGLINFGRRYYIPEEGRWLTPDPLGHSASPNLYAFVSNSPLTHIDLYGLYEDYWKSFPPEKTLYPIHTERYISDASFAYGAVHGLAKFGTSVAVNTAYLATLPVQTTNWAFGGPSPIQNFTTFNSYASFDFNIPTSLRSDLYHQSSFTMNASCELAFIAGSAYGLGKGICKAAQYGLPVLLKTFPKTPKTLAQTLKKPTSIQLLPKGHIWQEISPFKDKTSEALHEMFLKKGFLPKGRDPQRGYGNYLNPKNDRQYHIDPKKTGRYREPNHVDVSRIDGYNGNLNKKRFGYLEDD